MTKSRSLNIYYVVNALLIPGFLPKDELTLSIRESLETIANRLLVKKIFVGNDSRIWTEEA